MPTVVISPVGTAGQQFFDNNGDILSGGKIYTYAAGTTTPETTYTTSAGSVAHTNPVVLDSAGRVSGDGIWLTSGTLYKFVVKTSADVSLYTLDNISGPLSSNSTDASASVKGITKLSTAPASATDPIAVGNNQWATTTTAGITRLSTAPAVAATPIAVGDNDSRLVGLPYTAPSDASTTVKGITKLGAAPVSASDPIAVGNNQWSTTSAAGITRLSTAPAVAATPIAVGDNDGRVPTQGENDALAGTVGTPSSTNKYVTDQDTRLTNEVTNWFDVSVDGLLLPFDIYVGKSGGAIRTWATKGALVPEGILVTPAGVPADAPLGEEEDASSSGGTFPNWSKTTNLTSAPGSIEWRCLFDRPVSRALNVVELWYSFKISMVIINQISGMEGAKIDGFKFSVYSINSDGTQDSLSYLFYTLATTVETTDGGTPRYFVVTGQVTVNHDIDVGDYLMVGIQPTIYVDRHGAGAGTQTACVMINPATDRTVNLLSTLPGSVGTSNQDSITRSRIVIQVEDQ